MRIPPEWSCRVLARRDFIKWSTTTGIWTYATGASEPEPAVVGEGDPAAPQREPTTRADARGVDPMIEVAPPGASEIWEFYNTTDEECPAMFDGVTFEVLSRQAIAVDDVSGTPLEPLAPAGEMIPREPWETGVANTVMTYPGHVTCVRAHVWRSERDVPRTAESHDATRLFRTETDQDRTTRWGLYSGTSGLALGGSNRPARAGIQGVTAD